VGLAEILLRSPYLTDAIAETQTEVLVFSAKVFDEVMKISGMKEFFLEYLAKSLFILHSQIELNLPLPRLIRYVLVYSKINEDGSSSLAATQDEIARAIGVTRETVNKYLQNLQNEGLLCIGRGYIQIANREALDEKII
jgi:CRP-like cAMP-binding protein